MKTSFEFYPKKTGDYFKKITAVNTELNGDERFIGELLPEGNNSLELGDVVLYFYTTPTGKKRVTMYKSYMTELQLIGSYPQNGSRIIEILKIHLKKNINELAKQIVEEIGGILPAFQVDKKEENCLQVVGSFSKPDTWEDRSHCVYSEHFFMLSVTELRNITVVKMITRGDKTPEFEKFSGSHEGIIHRIKTWIQETKKQYDELTVVQVAITVTRGTDTKTFYGTADETLQEVKNWINDTQE